MANPYLNGGCGNVILPGKKPDHYALLDDSLTHYPLWVNADRNSAPGVDEIIDLFKVPWHWPDNYFDGALLAHVMEHCPHEIKLADDSPRAQELAQCQDMWYAVFAELHRVLSPGSMVHIISPFAWSQGANFDPTHTRYLLPETFSHSMRPDPNAPFEYANGNLHFETRELRPGVSKWFAHLVPTAHDTPEVAERKQRELEEAAATRLNVISEFYIRLEAIK